MHKAVNLNAFLLYTGFPLWCEAAGILVSDNSSTDGCLKTKSTQNRRLFFLFKQPRTLKVCAEVNFQNKGCRITTQKSLEACAIVEDKRVCLVTLKVSKGLCDPERWGISILGDI